MTKKTDNGIPPDEYGCEGGTEFDTPKTDDTIDEVLKRLLADVDDHMEFAGTMFKSKDMATLDVLNSLEKAKVDINNYFGGLEIKTRLNELEQVVIYGESENYALNRIKELKEAL